MLVPLSWLKDYVDIPEDISAQEFVDKMIMTGSEVEGFEILGNDIENVVTGRIDTIEKHPDSDHLLICKVNVGKGELLQIVTGAPNVFEGAVVPVALDGSLLPGDKKIKTGKLRGVVSEGMLCSGEELNVDPQVFPDSAVYGIWILPKETEIGIDIKKIIKNEDVIFDFKTYANRPDCMSIIGIARETAVTLGGKLHLPEVHVSESRDDVKNYISVNINDYNLCNRYCARVVKNVRLADSPIWMQNRLKRAGIRPINNVVDITNFVMLEYGQPMHAFDYACIKNGSITVKTSPSDSVFTTLDGKEYTLESCPLCIYDDNNVIGLAGVMGGLNSEITDNTSTVVLESANFNGAYIRATSRALGIRTEASARFEKGVSYESAFYALERAAQLFELLDAGDVVTGIIDVNDGTYKAKSFDASPVRIRELLGMDIPDEDMLPILDDLGFEPSYNMETGSIHVSVPYWRLDVAGNADIAEEVLRIYGYDKIPSSLMSGIVQGGKTHAQTTKSKIKTFLSICGLNEINTFSFISPKWFDLCKLDKDNTLTLLNPLGEDMSIMRTMLAPSMLNTVALNLSHGNKMVSLFEINRVFHVNNDVDKDKTPAKEANHICFAFTGKDFFYGKGIINQLFKHLNISDYSYQAGGLDMFHPGRKALISINERQLGYLGEVHPDVCEGFGISDRIILGELDLDVLTEFANNDVHVKAIPRTPAITLDMAVTVAEDVPVEDMLHAIKRSGKEILESVTIFDIYRGEHVEPGFKSVAFAMTYRSPERTLKDEEAKKAFNKAVRSLEAQFNAKLRD